MPKELSSQYYHIHLNYNLEKLELTESDNAVKKQIQNVVGYMYENKNNKFDTSADLEIFAQKLIILFYENNIKKINNFHSYLNDDKKKSFSSFIENLFNEIDGLSRENIDKSLIIRIAAWIEFDFRKNNFFRNNNLLIASFLVTYILMAKNLQLHQILDKEDFEKHIPRTFSEKASEEMWERFYRSQFGAWEIGKKEIFDRSLSNNAETMLLHQYSDPDCELLRSSSLPTVETLSTLPVTNTAYIRYDNQLFYVNKTSRICQELLSTNDTKFEKFDQEMKTNDLNNNSSKKLLSEELEKITSITGHTRGRTTEEISEVQNITGETSLEKLVVPSVDRAILRAFIIELVSNYQIGNENDLMELVYKYYKAYLENAESEKLTSCSSLFSSIDDIEIITLVKRTDLLSEIAEKKLYYGQLFEIVEKNKFFTGHDLSKYSNVIILDRKPESFNSRQYKHTICLVKNETPKLKFVAYWVNEHGGLEEHEIKEQYVNFLQRIFGNDQIINKSNKRFSEIISKCTNFSTEEVALCKTTMSAKEKLINDHTASLPEASSTLAIDDKRKYEIYKQLVIDEMLRNFIESKAESFVEDFLNVPGALPKLEKRANPGRVTWIVAGGPASGKTKIVEFAEKDLDADKINTAILNPDYYKKILLDPKKVEDPVKHAELTHVESSHINKRIMLKMQSMINAGKAPDILFDAVKASHDKILVTKEGNATINIYMATCSPEEAIRRAFDRGRRHGRFVPTEVILQGHKEATALLPEVLSKNNVVFRLFYTEVPLVNDSSPIKNELLLMSSSPTIDTLSNLPIVNTAYIRCNNQLYYVNKTKRVCDLLSIKTEMLEKFDLKMKTNNLANNVPRNLSNEELRKITSITGHPLPIEIASIYDRSTILDIHNPKLMLDFILKSKTNIQAKSPEEIYTDEVYQDKTKQIALCLMDYVKQGLTLRFGYISKKNKYKTSATISATGGLLITNIGQFIDSISHANATDNDKNEYAAKLIHYLSTYEVNNKKLSVSIHSGKTSRKDFHIENEKCLFCTKAETKFSNLYELIKKNIKPKNVIHGTRRIYTVEDYHEEIRKSSPTSRIQGKRAIDCLSLSNNNSTFFPKKQKYSKERKQEDIREEVTPPSTPDTP